MRLPRFYLLLSCKTYTVLIPSDFVRNSGESVLKGLQSWGLPPLGLLRVLAYCSQLGGLYHDCMVGMSDADWLVGWIVG